ncbi:DUF58 domain-containing protein [Planctomonas sp. JC2975]|uniref:DUF58 domain-containing protein n=1 Tax=Planctomonas sp. JC2975 TaxID=2729626 RepID=UPI001473451A|nr:DUF58 domain-containing protein [Planctomonas sp. JC2975]NNC11012.1 DUF58 domain-containing protein [Planctomonas sp. JC2975]
MTDVTTAERRTGSQATFALRELWRALLGGLAAIWRALRRIIDVPLTVVIGAVKTITPLGWIVVVSAVVSFGLAFVLGWAEFAYIGFALAAGMLAACGYLFGRATYRVAIELNPRRVTAGDRAMGRMEVVNTGHRPVLPTRMELAVGEGLAEFVVPRLAPGAEDESLFAIPTERRALIVAGPAVSVRGDQLGLLRRTTTWTDQVELFVHPKITRIAATARGLVKDLEGQTTKAITDSDLAFHALRAYEPGDDIRNVHWRSSARTGQLMVRQYQETRRSQLLLLMSADRRFYLSDDEFELAVSALASIAVEVAAEESELDVVWENARLRERTPMTLLDDTCRIQQIDSRYGSLREFARTIGARLPDPSLVIAVVGSIATHKELHALSTLYPTDTPVIVVRTAADEDPGLRKVGNAVVATVTALSELAGLLQRAGR